ncbi:MAG: molybdopterin-binding protein [Microbacteriaceae bacterium]
MSQRLLESAVVIVVSTSMSDDPFKKTTAKQINDWLADRGFVISPPIFLPFGYPLFEVFQQQLEQGHRIIFTTGGIANHAEDSTPEITAAFLEVHLPKLMEELRVLETWTSPHAWPTRGVAGFSGSSFVMNLPGSTAGVRNSLSFLDRKLPQLLEQYEEK